MMDFGYLIVGQPFRVADDFAMLKPCPTNKIPLGPPLIKGEKSRILKNPSLTPFRHKVGEI
jgi:hypothetical protein